MRFVRNNGLTSALLTAILPSMVGMTVAGYYHENEQLAQHGLQQISVGQYLTNDNFLSALFENGKVSGCRCRPMSFSLILFHCNVGRVADLPSVRRLA